MSFDRRAKVAARCIALAACAWVARPAHAQQAATPNALTLEAAVARSLERSERAQIADLRVRSAEARVDKARSFFLPDVTLSGVYTHRFRETRFTGADGTERVFQARNALNGSLVIGVTLFDGRSFPLYRQAGLEREAVGLDAVEQRRLLAFDTASLFLATLSQEQVLEAAGTRVSVAQQSVRDAQQRFEVGLVSSNDVTLLELQLSAAERDLTAARAAVRTVRIDLGHALARPVGEPLAAPAPLLEAAAGSAAALASGSARKQQVDRLDVAAQRKRAAALREFAEEPLWRWAPTLGLAGIGRATNEGGFSTENFDASVQLTLTWVLWDGGERSADRDDRLAQASAAELEARARQRSARTEVEQALVALERGHGVVAQATRTAEIARRNGEETAELYRQGLGTALAVADASGRLFSAEVELARARYDLAVGLLALRRALGLDPFGKEPVR